MSLKFTSLLFAVFAGIQPADNNVAQHAYRHVDVLAIRVSHYRANSVMMSKYA